MIKRMKKNERKKDGLCIQMMDACNTIIIRLNDDYDGVHDHVLEALLPCANLTDSKIYT